jgi:hypothetical protein
LTQDKKPQHLTPEQVKWLRVVIDRRRREKEDVREAKPPDDEPTARIYLFPDRDK